MCTCKPISDERYKQGFHHRRDVLASKIVNGACAYAPKLFPYFLYVAHAHHAHTPARTHERTQPYRVPRQACAHGLEHLVGQQGVIPTVRVRVPSLEMSSSRPARSTLRNRYEYDRKQM